MLRSTTRMLGSMSALAVLPTFVDCSQREKEIEEKIFTVSNRLKIALVDEERNCRPKNKDGIQICTLRNQRYGGWDGLPLVRIGNVRVQAPIEEVASLWLSHGSRKKWDSNFCDDSQLVKEYDSETVLAYIKGKARYLFPSRDYAFHICRVPGGLVGIRNYLSTAFVNTDASQSIPITSWSVRGNMNSILVLQPINAQTTDVTYVVEYAVNGWVPNFMGELVADNVIDTLRQMKKQLEAEEFSEEAQVSIDEAARIRFKKHQMQKEENKSTTIVNDVTSSREDLEKTVTILESKLRDLEKTQRTEGIDLSDLEKRIKSDIKRIKDRIKSM